MSRRPLWVPEHSGCELAPGLAPGKTAGCVGEARSDRGGQGPEALAPDLITQPQPGMLSLCHFLWRGMPLKTAEGSEAFKFQREKQF